MTDETDVSSTVPVHNFLFFLKKIFFGPNKKMTREAHRPSAAVHRYQRGPQPHEYARRAPQAGGVESRPRQDLKVLRT